MEHVDFRILGALEARVAGTPVDIGGPRQRIILAAMVLDAGQTHSVDHLIDVVWGDDPPSTARSQIKTAVSALRRAFRARGAGDTIETRPAGYAVEQLGDRLDLNRFEALVRRARSLVDHGQRRHARPIMRQALNLWRGRPLVDLPGAALRTAALRLQQRRLSVLEEYATLHLADDDYQEVVDMAVAVVAEHPTRERFWMLLMHALYRSGNRASALEAYRAARHRLVEELGLEPGPELQQLHQMILTGSDTSDLATGMLRPTVTAVTTLSPSMLPPDAPDFVDRPAVEADLLALLGSAPDVARQAIAVITGPPGVGKSALAVHVAHQLRESYSDGQLYVDLHGDTTPVPPVEALGRFLRAVGVSVGDIPRTLDERAEMYRSALSDRRMLVVLDNAADEAQVTTLVPGTPSAGVVVTSRARLSCLPGVHLAPLDTFTSEQAHRLLARVAGPARVDADPSGAEQLAWLCGYLPLALRIAGSKLAAKPHWTVADLVRRMRNEHRRLDELAWGHLAARPAFEHSYQSLPEPSRRLFRLLGALDAPHTAGWVAIALLDSDANDAEDSLEGLVDAHLLEVFRLDSDGRREALDRVVVRPAPVVGEVDVRYGFQPLLKVYARERAEAEEPGEGLRAAFGRAFSGWLSLAELARGPAWDVEGHTAVTPGRPWAPPLEQMRALIVDPGVWLAAEGPALQSAARQAAELGLVDLGRDLAGVLSEH